MVGGHKQFHHLATTFVLLHRLLPGRVLSKMVLEGSWGSPVQLSDQMLKRDRQVSTSPGNYLICYMMKACTIQVNHPQFPSGSSCSSLASIRSDDKASNLIPVRRNSPLHAITYLMGEGGKYSPQCRIRGAS